ncbi:hypothetical protein chiPu_0000624 [Chiloscyllium punctatum]|uniref:Secreted protein n=1 Tax=Chiloscyllium punctatum TaxID=137246 RepID=A0A401RVV2_CHIPU|nr:hypothetical protein [Chiloscyllium punctatum]
MSPQMLRVLLFEFTWINVLTTTRAVTIESAFQPSPVVYRRIHFGYSAVHLYGSIIASLVLESDRINQDRQGLLESVPGL